MTYFPATPRPVGKSKRLTLPGRYMTARVREGFGGHNEVWGETNQKPETRNPNEIPNHKPEKMGRFVFFWVSCFGHSFWFRVSGFWFVLPIPPILGNSHGL